MTQVGTIPVLNSERLILRGHLESDLDAAAAMWGAIEVVRYIGGRPFTREEVWHRMLRYIGHWAVRPYGYWAIVERATNRFVGEIGLADWKRESLSEHADSPESGWVLTPSVHGLGFATEALTTMLAWADAAFSCPTLCIINQENLVSVRLEIQRPSSSTP